MTISAADKSANFSCQTRQVRFGIYLPSWNEVVHGNACAWPCLNINLKTRQVNIEFWLSTLKLSLNGVMFVCSTETMEDGAYILSQKCYEFCEHPTLLFLHDHFIENIKICINIFLYPVSSFKSVAIQ